MSQSEADPNREILESLLNRYEMGESQSVLLNEVRGRYPNLEDDFRQIVSIRDSLQQTGAANQPLPNIPDFRILREIGRGGMGVVYEAEQVSLKRVVALKICRCDLNEKSQLRFNREQESLARLHHTNIVPVHTSGRIGPWQYFAMKFIDGTSLQERINNDRKVYLKASQLHHVMKHEFANANAVDDPTNPQSNQPQSNQPLKLTLSYYRSVASGMAEVADALCHAHAARVLHRDVKPSNIMVDCIGTYWLVDFGLSRDGGVFPSYDARQDTSPGAVSSKVSHSGITEIGQTLGTRGYMSLDQYTGASNEQTDIYGLGVTLYEVLSLRRAFDDSEWQSKIACGETPEPVALEQLVPTIPKDLAAICRKAMRAQPAERYASAAHIAADLRHWLAGEPTQARPAGYARRFWLWSRRNRILSAALLTVLCLLVFSTFSGWRWARSEQSRTIAEHLRGEAERSRAVAAEELVESQLFELKLSDILMSRLNATPVGWRDRTLALISKASKFANTDTRIAQLRNEAVETLRGFDAAELRSIVRDSTSVAFDATGGRVIAGGYSDKNWKPVGEAMKIELGSDSDRSDCQAGHQGAGPVAFQSDGKAVQLTWETMHELILWDVDSDSAMHRYVLPDSLQRDSSSRATCIFSDDASMSAVPCINSDGKRSVLVWSNSNGQLLFTFQTTATTAIAISRDNSLMATGDEDGVVSLWSLKSGEKLETVLNGKHRVQSLAFSPDASSVTATPIKRVKGRLLIGDAGSQAIIRNLETGETVSHLRGSELWVLSAAFSPTGTIVATGSPTSVALWNALTGERLAQLDAGQDVVDVRFSNDGSRLASVSTTTFSSGRICVWEIENGRGVREYLGLNSRIAQALFSLDDTLVAGLSQAGEVAVWERATAKLLYKSTVPPADYIDNTKIGFSLDGKTLYYCGQQMSAAWDALSGVPRSDPIQLNPALGNRLAFPNSGEVLVLRYETERGTQMPDDRTSCETDPRVFRVYQLNGNEPARPMYEYFFTNRGSADPKLWLIDQDASFDGSFFIVDAHIVPVGSERLDGERCVKAFNSLTGHEFFSTQTPDRTLCRRYSFPIQARDASGNVVRITLAESPPITVFKDLRTGDEVENKPEFARVDGTVFQPFMISNANKLAIEITPLLRRMSFLSEGRVRATLDRSGESTFHCFSNSGNDWLESASDGVITVYDQHELHSNLRQVNLEWD